MQFQSILILTGAGISAESGVDTFRDVGGIWSKVRLEDVATPEGFARDPAMVHDFYNQRRAGLAGVKPNPAHLALARLEREVSGSVTVVTRRPTSCRRNWPAANAASWRACGRTSSGSARCRTIWT